MTTNDPNDLRFMTRALELARAAMTVDETPVGALVTHQPAGGVSTIIAEAYNLRETRQDPSAHAELIAIRAAAAVLKSWRLEETTLYVTLEPCAMCAGLIILARIPRVVFGAYDPKAGACGSVMDVIRCPALNHQPAVTGGVLADDCGELLRSFFKAKRRSGRSDGSTGGDSFHTNG